MSMVWACCGHCEHEPELDDDHDEPCPTCQPPGPDMFADPEDNPHLAARREGYE